MRVLIIGDSQAAGPPGQVLEAALRALGFGVMRIGRSGQGAVDWSRELWSVYQEALARFRPSDVILVFGSNNRASSALSEAMKRFRDSAPSVWYAGPPIYLDEDRQRIGAEIRTMASRVFGKRYIDAWPFTGPEVERRPDGVHFTQAGGAVWGRAIADRWSGLKRGLGAFAVASVAIGALLWWLVRK